jgi:hypothetical protein
MIINNTFFEILEEQNILKTTKTKPIVDAIKNRKKISFYYSGPRKPKKDSVKPGYRVKAEAVALGLSKKGNLIIRAYVQPPSTSKTGFAKGGWRTFMVGRMGSVQITDEEFESKRPNYKEGDDSSMSVTYVTTDWTKEPKGVKPTEKPQPEPQDEPTIQAPKPEVKPTEPKPEELPQPKPTTKPAPQPEPQPKPQVEPTDVEPEMDDEELPQPKPEEKPLPNPEDEENKELQESIKKIKSLMFS